MVSDMAFDREHTSSNKYNIKKHILTSQLVVTEETIEEAM